MRCLQRLIVIRGSPKDLVGGPDQNGGAKTSLHCTSESGEVSIDDAIRRGFSLLTAVLVSEVRRLNTRVPAINFFLSFSSHVDLSVGSSEYPCLLIF